MLYFETITYDERIIDIVTFTRGMVFENNYS